MNPASAANTAEAAPTPTAATEGQADASQPSSAQGYLGISRGVQTRCRLPAQPKEAPQFDFDDIALRERGRNILDGVVSCMVDGSLKNESITIVGHTDPRGAEAYNRELGRRRAESVRDFLVGKGVPAGRIAVRSRGEQEAQGTDVDSWQLDRRVDIEEATPSSAP